MFRTLESFQSEWFEKKLTTSSLESSPGTLVPDVYAKNEHLNDRVVNLVKECEKLKESNRKLQEDYSRLSKERDFHRMHHRRITQEKDKLLNDIKRQAQHYKNYEPTLKELRRKYETAMKEKMLSLLERDRANAHLNAALENMNVENDREATSLGTGYREDREKGKTGPTQKALSEARAEVEYCKKIERMDLEDINSTEMTSHPQDSEWPVDRRVNPALYNSKNLPKFNYQTLKVDVTVKVSDLPVSSVAIHPTKELAVTGCDDKSWYLWSVPSHETRNTKALEDPNSKPGTGVQNFALAELLMSGQGHSDWISSVDFHPSGRILATGSGDATVRIWDLGEKQQAHAFREHQNAVWSVNFHTSGDFLASCSMDNTAKIWDLGSLRCRATLRGHNFIDFKMCASKIFTFFIKLILNSV